MSIRDINLEGKTVRVRDSTDPLKLSKERWTVTVQTAINDMLSREIESTEDPEILLEGLYTWRREYAVLAALVSKYIHVISDYEITS